MDKKTSQRTGGHIVVRVLLIAVILFEGIWLFNETRGDFANGILFFMAEQLQPLLILFYVLLFSLGYILGRRAGNQIIMRGKSDLIIGFWNGLLQSLILVLYLIAACAFRQVLGEVQRYLLQTILLITIPTVLLWLLAAHLIRKKMAPSQ